MGQIQQQQRIVSLVPHATELLFALGLGDRVVGVTHECDWPAEALALPKLTGDVLPPEIHADIAGSQAAIDAAVRERTESGEAIYTLDEQLLAELQPDLIVTQELCPVCAVSYDDVAEIAKRLPKPAEVVALDPHTFGETLGDVRTIAGRTDSKDAGVDLVAEISARVDKVKIAVREAERKKVVALEWLDPVFTAGHWTPQLVEMAGGYDVCGMPGERSETTTWEQIALLEPEIAICMLCGYDEDKCFEQAQLFAEQIWSTGVKQVFCINASAFFSRPGPRLVVGLELLAHILNPTLVEMPEGTAIRELVRTGNARS